MNRSEARRCLAEYADGEVDPAIRQEFERYLAGDPELRAEVERWRLLRRCLYSVIASEPVPTGLEVRVRQRLARRRSRAIRFSVPATLATAAVLLGAVLWPRGAVATTVEARDFARIHRNCALGHRHDALGLRNSPVSVAVAKISQEVRFIPCLPDLTASGYQLDGVCLCAPRPNVTAVHAFYRLTRGRGEAVSVFSSAGKISLCACGSPCGDCRAAGQRHYHSGQDDGVNLITWDEGPRSFVLCGNLRADALVRLAEGVQHVAQHAPPAGKRTTLAGVTSP